MLVQVQPQHLTTTTTTQLPSLPPNRSFSLLFSLSPRFPQFRSSRNPRRPSSVKVFTVRASTTSNAHSHTLLPKTAIQRIAEKLRYLGFTDEDSRSRRGSEGQPPLPSSPSAGEIFVPLPSRLPKQRVGHTIDTSWSTPENPVPAPGSGAAFGRFRELKREVRKEKRELAAANAEVEEERQRVPTMAELTLPGNELRRARTLGLDLKKKLKIGKAGITEGIVNGIHERWRRSEVVKIECEDICRMNMKRTHDLLEKKTGGLVVWRSGSKVILYRGKNYVYPYFISKGNSTPNPSVEKEEEDIIKDGEQIKTESLSIPDRVKPDARIAVNETVQPALIRGVGLPNRVRFQLPGEAQLAEEADLLIEGLGPRFTDWWGYDPQPVDADLLPPFVRGYRKPFRLLPYGVHPKLTNDEMTTLKRLSRPLPCHFALGRNRNHQGLASSIVKLWEKCEVAKIAIKRGVQNTNSEIMAEEIKNLTGGILLSRDREFIVFYRGKDFLPRTVSSALEERRKSAFHAKRLRTENNTSVEAGQDEDGISKDGGGKPIEVKDNNKAINLREPKRTSIIEASVRRTSIKLSMALEKKEKAEKLLAELENVEMLQQPEVDKEGITPEERHMLRKIGLRMHPFLLLGRRGVFDGTVENMHLHWKYRELVKIITNEKNVHAVQEVARTLETESGGILVSVERVSKGYAIIVYRGKNYNRPSSLRPATLLNKKAALKRSVEEQRRKSLKLHVLKLKNNIEDLKSQLVKDKEAKERLATDDSIEMVQEEVEGLDPPESLTLDDEIDSVSPSASTTSPDDIAAVQEEVEGLDPPESLTLDDEIDSVSPSASTTSPDDIAVPERMSFSADVGVHSGVSNDNQAIDSSDKSEKYIQAPVLIDKGRKEIPLTRTISLSNKERLLLRRQALLMKYRPVLSVGKSNIITGVAKTIKQHFENYPLAVVNVKGRAKGTSVKEVVFMLEQATGAVLISQEPCKVILYRGWGAEENSDQRGKKKKKMKKGTNNMSRELELRPPVSPELLEAIRAECGLQNQQLEGKFP